MHEIVDCAAQHIRLILFDIACIAVSGAGKHCEIFRIQMIPVFQEQIVFAESPVALNTGKRIIEMCQDLCCPFLRILLRELTQKQFAGAGCFRCKQILHFLCQQVLSFCIEDRQDACNFKPLIDRRFMENIKEFVHIKDAGRLDQDTVKMLHTERDELCPEASAVTMCITAAGDHFELAVFAFELLQQRHIRVDRAEIIFKDRNALAAVDEMPCIFEQERRFPGSENAGDQINFRHKSSTFLSVFIHSYCITTLSKSQTGIVSGELIFL